MPKKSSAEKREYIKRQLYGKETIVNLPSAKNEIKISEVKTNQYSFSFNKTQSPSLNSTTDPTTNYLKKDLVKVLILSTIALLVQVLLYYSYVNNLIKFNLLFR